MTMSRNSISRWVIFTVFLLLKMAWAQEPSVAPSSLSAVPSGMPSLLFSSQPSDQPSDEPLVTEAPSGGPSAAPSEMPSEMNSLQPSDMPSSVPTDIADSPTVVPTSAPSAAPSVLPSYTPSAFPTGAPSDDSTSGRLVEGQVNIILRSVEKEMDDTLIELFNADCTQFFQDKLGNTYSDINATLDIQTLLTSPSNRRQLAVAPLDTVVKVEGNTITDKDSDDLNLELFAAVNAYGDELIALFQESDSEYFGDVTRVNAVAGEGPTEPPTGSPGDDDDDGLSAGGIAGVAIGSAFFVGLVATAGLIFANKRKTATGEPVLSGSQSDDLAAASAAPKSSATASQQQASSKQMAASSSSEQQSTSQVLQTMTDEELGVDTSEQDSLAENSALGSPSLMSNDFGADTMSYAYSLDGATVDHSLVQSTAGGGGIVGTEVAGRDVKPPNTVMREVVAPPGKLGIVIDTTLEGPVVHKVNEGSPLEGELFPGDIIVAIDDVDTRAMSASAITALMVKTANQRRKLQVVSEETQ